MRTERGRYYNVWRALIRVTVVAIFIVILDPATNNVRISS